MATVRTIAAPCTSGDGTVLQISTLGQGPESALRFHIGPAGEESGAMVYVSPEDLADLLVFQVREQELYDLEYDTEAEDDDEEEID